MDDYTSKPSTGQHHVVGLEQELGSASTNADAAVIVPRVLRGSSEPRSGGVTRRSFSRRALGVIIGSSAFLGGFVGFAPTALAVDEPCVFWGIFQSCYGIWSNFFSHCPAGGTITCICECVGTGGCGLFRAHAIFLDNLCCCNH
jgi:hypothetical protein